MFQEKWGEYPVYEMVSMEEHPSGKEFTMCVYDPYGNFLSSATHSIKKKAEQMAASRALKQARKA